MNSHYLTKEAVRFFVEYLVMNDNGELVVNPSESPENSYIDPKTGQIAHLAAGCTMDSQILRDLFTGYLAMAEHLGDNDILVVQTEAALTRLPKTKIHPNGTIMEWPSVVEEPEPGHRHISHLYGLYPSDQISPFTTPALAVAAKKTIERRLKYGGGQNGWSRAWMTSMWARLLEGEKAYSNIRYQLAHASFDNLFNAHPQATTHDVFQIDGNLGGVAAITEMLVQCVVDRIVLLPALPEAWSAHGSLEGVLLKGNMVLSMTWQNKQVTRLTIRSQRERQVCLEFNGQSMQQSLHAGDNQVL